MLSPKQIGTICFSKFFKFCVVTFFAIFCGFVSHINSALAGDCATNGSLNSGYTQLQYLESTSGTGQLINTGYTAKTKYISGSISMIPTQNSSHSNIVAGSYDNLSLLYTTDFSIWVRSQGSLSSNITWTVGTLYDIDFALTSTGRTLTINGSSVSDSTVMNKSIGEILIFGNSSYPFVGRIYSFELYDNGSLALNLIPAVRNSDGVLGMCNTVNGTFLTNSGYGTFTAGPFTNVQTNLHVTYSCGDGTGTPPSDSNNYTTGGSVTTKTNSCTPPSGKMFSKWLCGEINLNAGSTFSIYANTTCAAQYVLNCGSNGVLTSDFTQLQYIESTSGGLQRISTGYFPATRYISGSVSIMPTQDSSHSNIVMSMSDTFSVGYGSQGFFSWGKGIASVESHSSWAVGTLYNIGFSLSSTGRTLTVNGSSFSDNAVMNQSIGEIVVFYSAPTGGGDKYPFVGRVYSFQFYDNGTLALNLIPAKRNSDNALGMCNTVNGEFLTNSGSGTFTAGPVVGTQTVNLTWYDNNTTISGPASCIVGGTFLPPTPPARTGYIFTGWKIKTVNP